MRMGMSHRDGGVGAEHPRAAPGDGRGGGRPRGAVVRVGGNQLIQAWRAQAGRPGLFVKMRFFNSALASGRWTWGRLWSSSVRGSGVAGWGRGRGGMSSAS